MNVEFDERVGDLYEKLYTTVRTCVPEATNESVNVALSAINNLAVVLAVHNGVSREDFNAAVMYTFDQYSAITTRAVDQGVH